MADLELKKTERIICETKNEILIFNEKKYEYIIYDKILHITTEYDDVPIWWILHNAKKGNFPESELREILKNKIRDYWMDEIDDVLENLDELDFAKTKKMLKNFDFIDKNFGFVTAVTNKILTDYMEK